MTTDATTTRAAAWTEAASILAEAWRFFARHYLIVLAFGGLASIQRFLAVSGDAAWAAGVGGEVFTAAVRLAFIAWAVRRLLRDRPVAWVGATARWSAWNSRHWPTVLASMAFLLVLTVVLKVLPDALAGRVGGIDVSTWLAWELAIKNVTVIPFTMLWMTILFAAWPLRQSATSSTS